MTFLHSKTEAAVLVALNRAFGGPTFLSAADVAERIRPMPSMGRVELALERLKEEGLVWQSHHESPKRYAVASAGIDVATDLEEGKNLGRYGYVPIAKMKETKMVQFTSLDWTKWGTIIAGISLAVTIAIAVIK